MHGAAVLPCGFRLDVLAFAKSRKRAGIALIKAKHIAYSAGVFMYKYSDRCVRNMRDLLDMALMAVDSGMASAADRAVETEKQVAELSERLFEAACERGCKSIDFNYLLLSDDGECSRIMSFASDQEAIDFVKSHFEIFGSVCMTANLAHIYRRTDMHYYLAATVDMASLEVVQVYPVGYWTGVDTLTDEQPEDDHF